VLQEDTAAPGKSQTSALVHVVRVFTALLARLRQQKMSCLAMQDIMVTSGKAASSALAHVMRVCTVLPGRLRPRKMI
jgi:hypothetical protein